MGRLEECCWFPDLPVRLFLIQKGYRRVDPIHAYKCRYTNFLSFGRLNAAQYLLAAKSHSNCLQVG